MNANTEQSFNSKLPKDYIERVYAGWLGKVIGVRHGANIENWTYDRIEKAFGEIDGYLHDFKNFAADDDTNGPLFFLRALEDYTHTRDITPKEMGLTWLNYAPDGHGFFWWGGYGVSTEDTAYQNLKSGIHAPRSGSISQNGKVMAEQIGGQIFSDVWGLIAPGQPELAAEYAAKMASVSHDGNGKYGGMFIAACIAEAFIEKDIGKIIDTGLSVIPEDSHYAQVVKDIKHFHEKNPSDWKECFNYIYNHYGYDRYDGVCHIIPNSAVIILALLYGAGDFSRTINICNMCGWDTDCNVGNVGTIVGVLNGIEGIDQSWRAPINDFLCNSSVIGSLNIVDLPWCASYIANLGYKVMNESPPKQWEPLLNVNSGRTFHFEYPGSTHAFRVEADSENTTGFIENTSEHSATGERSLKVVFDEVNGGFGYRAFIKTYYTPDDFNDSRYDPSFSPILYPGQSINCTLKVNDEITDVEARLFIRDRNSNKLFYGPKANMNGAQWQTLEFTIPAMKNVCIEEAGIEIIPRQESGFIHTQTLIAYVDQMTFSGQPAYEIEFSNEMTEAWSIFHKEVSQITHLRGIWVLEDDALCGSHRADESAEAYTGNIDWENYSFTCQFAPTLGDFHNINFRVQGGIRSYAVGLSEDNQVTLYKNDNGYQTLVQEAFKWTRGEIYEIKVTAHENQFTVFINGQHLFTYTDEDNPYLTGQIGFSNFNGSRTSYKSFKVEKI